MRLLFVSEYFWPKAAGGENWLKTLAEDLSKRGHKVFIVTSGLPNAKYKEIINGVSVHRVFRSGGLLRRLFFMVKLHGFLKKFIAEHDIDLVINLANVPTIPSCRAARACGVPSVTSVHLFLGKKWFKISRFPMGLLNYFFEKIIFKFSNPDLFHVLCDETANAVSRLSKSRVVKIPNFLKKESFRIPSSKDAVRKRLGINGIFLLFAGSLTTLKNIEKTVDSILSIKDVDLSFVVAGDGPLMSRLMRIKDPRLKILGWRNDINKLIASCDALVLCSIQEQMPLVVMDALAYNRPVIVTPVGAIPEMKFSHLKVINDLSELPDVIKGLRMRKLMLNNKVLNTYDHNKIIPLFEREFERLVNG